MNSLFLDHFLPSRMLHSPSSALSSDAPSSSSASLGADQSSDQQYDIPWEFKNRALAAVLGQQQQKSPEAKAKNGEMEQQQEKETEKVERTIQRALIVKNNTEIMEGSIEKTVI